MNSTFTTPLYMQRYQFVVDFIKKNESKKVVDLGCNDCALLRRLKFHREIQLLCGVDQDGTAMKKKMHALAPIPTDYLHPGDSPLTVELYKGSVTERDARLKGFDLAVSIELIEHLHLAEVVRFSEVLFGYMSPASVIVSTPNAEFNPLLPGLKGFRHTDHKFEWTRAEFQAWAVRVCVKFGYEVEFTGVGQTLQSRQRGVGFCSQIAVFQRTGRAGRCGGRVLPHDGVDETFSYTMLYSVAYPSLTDHNVLQRTLVNEVLYKADWMNKRWMQEARNRAREEDSTETVYNMQQTGGGETGPVEEPSGGGTAEEDVRWRNVEGGPEIYKQGRCVCVPLASLWLSCPRIRVLSGTLENLSRFIRDDSRVRLTQNGSAVMVEDQDQDQEEEEELEEYLDVGAQMRALTRQVLPIADEEEDWEAEL